jgi:DNA-binding transcriptional regulator LsrR (DeoR family)
MGRKRKQKEHLKLTNRQLFEIFRDHHQKKISQAEIAKQYSVSPSTISKIMSDEKDRFVRYVLLDPRDDLLEIEDKIKKRFSNLKKVIVVPAQPDVKDAVYGTDKLDEEEAKIILRDIRMLLIIAAANELQHKDLEDKILSLPMGPLVRDILRIMHPIKTKETPDIIVTSSGFHGGPFGNSIYDPSALVTGPAERVYPNVVKRVVIPCPAFLPNDLADQIEKEVPIVKDTIEIANQTNVLVTGFGTRSYEKSRKTFAGVLEKKYWPGNTHNDISKQDYFVGEMAGSLFLARNGNFIDLKTHRSMGLRRQTIEAGKVEIIGVMRPRTMSPEGGKEWLWNYIAAARWVSTLIIDSFSAEMMIDEIENYHM